jgi:hypothetical protein
MAAKIELTERQSAGAAAGSDDRLDEQLRVSVDALLHPSPPTKPAVELDELILAITHQLDQETSQRKAIYNRLAAIEDEIKSRGSGGFARYLVAICIGVAAAVAWQSYGTPAKQIIATSAPELGWSPEAKQVIASWVEQVGWTKSPAGPENTAAQPSPVAQPAPTAPVQVSLTALRESVQQLTAGQASLGQTVDQLAASQDQMVHQIDMLQTSNQAILEKIPAPPPPPPVAAPARKLTPRTPPSSRPIPPHLPPHP